MKSLSLILLFILCSFCGFSQTESINFKKKLLNNKNLIESTNSLTKYDFSKLFLHTNNSDIYGFIGTHYQRLRVKLISVTKDSLSANTYHVYGKSMVKNNIDEFKGTIIITNIKQLKAMFYGTDDEYKNKGLKGEYIIIADYHFFENKNQPHSGEFKGICESEFYLDKNSKVHYNDIDIGDSYTNNQFVGEWASYDGKLKERCNWGDFRTPNSGDLDIGAGDFSPNDKYLKYGWQDVRDGKENAKWWE